MDKEKKLTMNIGIISFLVVFVILCLVTFSVLSLASAKSNDNLVQKSIQHKNDYYELCNQGESILQNIDQKLLGFYQSASHQENYYSMLNQLKNLDEKITINNHRVSYETTQGTQKLYLEIEVIYPGDRFYKLIEWSISSHADWSPYNGLNIL